MSSSKSAKRPEPAASGFPSFLTVAIAGLGIGAAYMYGAFSPSHVAAVVQTTSGRAHGQISPGTSGVSEYLGIPFAKAPIGKLRWAPPEPLDGISSDRDIDATKYGASCPAKISDIAFRDSDDVKLTGHASQVLMSILRQPHVTYSEDCLSLNIWTKPHSGEEKKAVLVWIHGGGYNTGTTNNAGYNGKYFADHNDVIIVSVNYRLNMFGFPGNPHIRNNIGLLDHRRAVEWVRDNIAAFGGDPERITLFGESAGGSAVDYYSYAWTADPIVNGFIAQSGTVFSPNTQANVSTSAKVWYNVTTTLGCGTADSDADQVLDCMRSKPWKEVQDAIPNTGGLSGIVGNFGPTVDEIVVFSDYPERSAAGNLSKKPLVIGTTDNEAGLFKATFACQDISYSEKKWNDMQRLLFTCASSHRALASVLHKIPTWRYRFFGEFAGLKITTHPDSGAWHGSDVVAIFGTDNDVQNKFRRSDTEHAMVNYMRGAWAAFAKDPVNGLNDYGFPQYHPSKESVLRLGYNNETGPQSVLAEVHDIDCKLPKALADLVEQRG